MIFEYEFKKNEKEDELLRTEYGKSKGEKFEELVYGIFQTLFNNAEIYHNLTYCTPDKVKHESDVIVDTGNYLLIVEVKLPCFKSVNK